MSVFINVDAVTGRILGRVKEATDSSIEISDELFGRYLGDPSAFFYYADRKEIDLREDYIPPKLSEISPVIFETYQTKIQDEIYVPELEVSISIAGVFGRVLIAALSLAQYVPQSILIYDKGAFRELEINSENAKYIATAFAKHSTEILTENQNEQAD